jgi:hypothetical protein
VAAGKAAASRPEPAENTGERTNQGNPDVRGQASPGDYGALGPDLDGMHNDSWLPATQAAGSPEEAAAAAREAAAAQGGHADELFAGSPGVEGPAPNLPSTLNMDRHASAARTGRAEMRERRREHTETSPAVTGGDVDADWESAYSVGDEAPGGDNPTPDQDIVDEVGRALGVEYEDAEELKGAEKIQERDRHRWELDPASSEDYDERAKEGKGKR